MFNVPSYKFSFNQIMELPPDIINQVGAVQFIHKELLEYVNSKLLGLEKDIVRIKLSESVLDAVFFVGDNFSLILNSDSFVYRLDCIIKEFVFSDIFFDTFEITGTIKSISLRKELRSHKRYTIKLLGKLKSVNCGLITSVKVKDISSKGFKIISDKCIDLGKVFDLLVTYSDEKKLSCKVRAVRKSEFGKLFIYGLEIIDITKNDSMLLDNILNSQTP